jgi:16S rRNA (cytosine967-C5)-methyltransferase
LRKPKEFRPPPKREPEPKGPAVQPLSPHHVAAAIIRDASRDRPADQLLRERLARAKLPRAESGKAAEAVFAYFRWFGFLRRNDNIFEGIRAAEELDANFATVPADFSDDDLLRKAIPGWTRDHAVVTADWVRTLQRKPVLWLRARRGRGLEATFALGDAKPFGEGKWSDTLEYCGTADLFRVPAFHDGLFEIQDIASQAVGILCAPKAGETWWDACAGEGGKLLHLAELMENRGMIWATDPAEWRLTQLKRRTARAKVFNYRSAVWNNRDKAPIKTKFDGVLVDAPCSGLGTWQRNPQARWTATIEDVRELAAEQSRILRVAAGNVKPGGVLIYAVCTLTQEETSGVADQFEAEMGGFQPLERPDPFTGGTAARHFFWPQTTRGNGMFVAIWRKAKG